MIQGVNVRYRNSKNKIVTTHLGRAFVEGCINTEPKNYKGDVPFKKHKIRRRICIHVNSYVNDMGGKGAHFDII